MCCLFVLVLYVHYCRVVCSTNLCSPVLFSYFQIHVSFVVVFVIGQSVQVQVSRLKAFVPNGLYFCQSVAYVRCLPYEIYSRPPTPYFVTVY